MKRFELCISIDAETVNEARIEVHKLLTGKGNGGGYVLLDKGFVHPDGKVRQCTVPPTRMRVLNRGSERNEPPKYLAVPTSTKYTENDWWGDVDPPKGSLMWLNNKWVDLGS